MTRSELDRADLAEKIMQMRSKVALATMAIDGWSICGKSENGVYALGMMLDEVIAGLTEVEEILHPSKPKAVENEAA